MVTWTELLTLLLVVIAVTDLVLNVMTFRK